MRKELNIIINMFEKQPHHWCLPLSGEATDVHLSFDSNSLERGDHMLLSFEDVKDAWLGTLSFHDAKDIKCLLSKHVSDSFNSLPIDDITYGMLSKELAYISSNPLRMKLKLIFSNIFKYYVQL